MDLKKKLQSLVKSKSSTDSDAAHSALSDEAAALNKFKEHIQESKYDPRLDQENIDSIEDVYFQDAAECDINEHELKKLTADPSLAEIEATRMKIRTQLQSVSKRVSELILENHPAYDTELKRVMELQETLQAALVICSEGRRCLLQSQKEFSVASIKMLANHRKRRQLFALMRSLKTIKTLQRTDVRLREMLEKEDYPGAIELCLECQKAATASTFRHYTCISELSSKLQDTLEAIEEQLDIALSRTCKNFDEKHYHRVQKAYQLLGKTQTALDQMHMHYASTIHTISFNIVLGYVELLCSGDNSFQKRQYHELCKYVTSECFIPILKDLCKALWGVMVSYRKARRWHEQQHEDIPIVGEEEHETTGLFNRRYVEQKLMHGQVRIWQEIQLKVRSFLLSTDMSSFKFNEFTHILDLVHRLIVIGEEFSGTKSEILQEALHKQTLQYFKQYHVARMEELKMFLENEGWELCPVKPSFNIFQLQEFTFMRDYDKSPAQLKKLPDLQDKLLPTSNGLHVADWFDETNCPFDKVEEKEVAEDILAQSGDQLYDSDDDVPEALRGDYIDETTGSTHSRGSNAEKKFNRRNSLASLSKKPLPTLTNSSLTVLRQFGKYIQMVQLLEPIAFDVILSMSQLLDFYLYTVYRMFASGHMMDDVVESKPCISSKLQTTLQRVTDALYRDVGSPNGELSRFEKRSWNAENLYGLSERLVAVESLIYLARQFEFLQGHLEKALPASKKAFLQQFHSQTISPVCELRYPAYRASSERVLNPEQLISLITQVKWDIKEIMSEHSPYVEIILREMQVFSMRLEQIAKHVPVSQEVRSVLWELCSKGVAQLFVEGYAYVKKCTNEGRALMQLDFQQFVLKFERIADIRPVPGREYVEMFIKAYYLPEEQLEQWVRDHKEYTPRQASSIVACVPHLNKKAKQRIFTQIEDPDKTHKRDNSPFSQLQNLAKRN